jgi:CubicO group peptidase (beta-lactamase class C family)
MRTDSFPKPGNPHEQPGEAPNVIERVSTVVREQMSKWSVPGLSLAIANGADVAYEPYGIASIATQQPVRKDTLFQIGSISKIFTTTLIMTLVDEGKVDLDTPVITWVPDLPLTDGTARTSITLRHLVTHMSGFYGDRFDDHGRGDDALARKVAAFYDLRQQTAPGELWTYCNAGFDLAGRVAEIVGQDTFENLMRKRVFDPLQLDSITYFADEAIRHPVSVGHESINGTDELTISDPWPIPRCSNPAGGISATSEHLVRFARMHMNDGALDGVRVISAESARLMRSYQATAEGAYTWGLGWRRSSIDNVAMVGHGGATNGFTAKLLLVPERNFIVVALTNHDHGSQAYPVIEAAALREVLGLVAPKPTIIELPAEEIARFAGTYHHDLATTTLTPIANGLEAKVRRHHAFNEQDSDGLPYRLEPTGPTTFVARDNGNDGTPAEFILNPDGSVRFYRIGGRLGYPVES